jgi:polyhydroxybutyrate depolymerase
MRIRLLALMLGLLPTLAGAACGPEAGACETAEGAYHIALPDSPDDAPAVLILHGWGGTGAGLIQSSPQVGVLRARGYAVIAPEGLPRAQGAGGSWQFRPGEERRDDVAFLRSVADDAAARFGLNRGRMMLAGFSVGGSMATYVACADPSAFAAFAPVAGSFWDPLPLSCAGPVRLLHVHGWADETVPLEGRRIGSAGLTQGDVFASLAILRQASGCDARRPDTTGRDGIFLWRTWSDCAPGAGLMFALTEGGHAVPKGWATFAADWFEQR